MIIQINEQDYELTCLSAKVLTFRLIRLTVSKKHNTSASGSYNLHLTPAGVICSCPGYQRYKHCKHQGISLTDFKEAAREIAELEHNA